MTDNGAPEDGPTFDEILSVQLYTLRNLNGLEQTLDLVASSGYRLAELTGNQLLDHAATGRALASRGLLASSSHIGLDELRTSLDTVIDACGALAIDQIFMPAVPDDRRAMPVEGWRALGVELGTMADKLAEHGILLGYHNHDWELRIERDGMNALEHLFDAAGGAALTFQVDIAWLIRGGADPYDWLRRYQDRVVSVHVKDLAAAGRNLDEDGWADVGSGTVDWPSCWQAALDAGARYMVVEHDLPKDPAATIRNSRNYLQRTVG